MVHAKARLAVDLGAESGRVFVGSCDAGVLSIRQIHRFSNHPVVYGKTSHWDVPRLWAEICRALALTDLEEIALRPLPHERRPEQSQGFQQFHNYAGLPRREVFRIEYWALEEAKLQRAPAEAEFGRTIALVLAGGNGVGREVAQLLARKGARIVVAKLDGASAKDAADSARRLSSADMVVHTFADLGSSRSLAEAIQLAILEFGGLEVVVNTAAIYPVPGPDGKLSESQCSKTFQVNLTSHYLLAQEAGWVFRGQRLGRAMVLTSSANAVVSQQGTEAYDASKAAVNHLVRELAVRLGPDVRVDGISPSTVVADSTMFPRDRIIHSLKRYNVPFLESESTEELRSKLAEFYARRTLTQKPISPQDCANAIVWLAGEQSAKTTGHIIPFDGGLRDASLR